MTNAREVSKQLADLLRREHEAMADFLAALADFHHERLWVDLGYASLFYYLHRELGLSKGAAAYRKTAAELIERFPEIEEPLRDGRLCITSIVELARVITPENRAHVLPRFFHRSKREAMELVAELQPHPAPPLRTVVTAATTMAMPGEPAAATTSAPQRTPQVELPSCRAGRPADLVDASFRSAPQKSSRPEIEPLTGDLRRFHITVSKKFLEKLAASKDALSHAMPRATEEEILEAGLDLLLARDTKRKGLVARPLKAPRPSKSDHIPAHVTREVWKRDEGKCQWPLANGGICGRTVQLERDHRTPRGKGGKATSGNIGIACKFHNDLAARDAYGDEHMDRFTRNPRKPDRAREPVEAYLPARKRREAARWNAASRAPPAHSTLWKGRSPSRSSSGTVGPVMAHFPSWYGLRLLPSS